jgi:hypothetical protein
MTLIMITLIAGLLSITAFFYGGHLVLQWLEMADSPGAGGSFAGRPGPKLAVAHAPGAVQALPASGLGLAEPVINLKSFDRLDDDGGNQHL